MDQLTAGACARILLKALENGSRPQIERALQRAEAMGSSSTPDPRENEFRDLLAAVIDSVHASQAQLSDPVQRSVAMRMLTHLAAAA